MSGLLLAELVQAHDLGLGPGLGFDVLVHGRLGLILVILILLHVGQADAEDLQGLFLFPLPLGTAIFSFRYSLFLGGFSFLSVMSLSAFR